MPVKMLKRTLCGERDRQEERAAGESAALLHGTRVGVMSYNPKARMYERKYQNVQAPRCVMLYRGGKEEDVW